LNDSIRLSIVVPTFREALNVPVLLRRLDQSLTGFLRPFEVILVDDDSNDGIIEAVEREKAGRELFLIVRRGVPRDLSRAVADGLARCRGEYVVVMDADLSHPPETIAAMIAVLEGGEADFVIGSRFVPGGGAPHFTWRRRLNALVSRLLARPLVGIRDPMAGFFAFPRRLLRPEIRLDPIGFKIGLELLVKLRPARVREIPIQFQDRLYGETKLSLKEMAKYLVHLQRLFRFKYFPVWQKKAAKIRREEKP
jgi:dolichol-phosphate mannosyltransferase